MGRKETAINRCKNCRININWCFCHHLKEVQNQTNVSFIMHHREKHLPSNTVQYAAKILSKSQIFVHGVKDKPLIGSEIIDQKSFPLYLFPSDEAIFLDDFLKDHSSKEIQLIIPDGSWRQATKMQKRIPGLKSIQVVKLRERKDSTYLLRNQKEENFLCTYEAMADALGIIEGVDLKDKLLVIFDKIVQTIMMSRLGLPANQKDKYPEILRRWQEFRIAGLAK